MAVVTDVVMATTEGVVAIMDETTETMAAGAVTVVVTAGGTTAIIPIILAAATTGITGRAAMPTVTVAAGRMATTAEKMPAEDRQMQHRPVLDTVRKPAIPIFGRHFIIFTPEAVCKTTPIIIS